YQNTQVHPGHLALQNTDNFDGQAYEPYYYYSTQGLQTGIQFTIANWHFLFSPKFERQKNSTNFMHNALTAYRFRTTVGTSLGDHDIDLSAEYSYAKADGQPDW